MSIDLRKNIKNNIAVKDEVSVSSTNIDNKISNTNKPFRLGNKIEDKTIKKSFPVYMNAPLQKELDNICKKRL